MLRIKLIFILVAFFFPAISYALPAFPGAEGFGANATTGGRGGTVYIIDTLSDSPGDGSTFREAVEASGTRYITFEVSGYLELDSKLTLADGNVTIAGETSPGGVATVGGQMTVRASNVIIRHMRFRTGNDSVDYERTGADIRYYDTENKFSDNVTTGNCVGNFVLTPPPHPKATDPSNNGYVYPCVLNSGADPATLHSMTVIGPEYNGGTTVENVILDHCSFSWGIDETLAITGGVQDITISSSIISGGINYAGHDTQSDHSKGMLIDGQDSADPLKETTRISVHHNYVDHANDRVPLVNADAGSDVTADMVNNVFFDWYGQTNGISWRVPKVNWVQNYAKQGIYSSSWSREVNHGSRNEPAAVLLYVVGNLGSTRLSQSDPDWNVGGDVFSFENADQSTDWRTLVRHVAPTITDETEMSLTLANTILTDVGAKIPALDSYDTTVIADFAAGTFRIPVISDTDYPADYPVFSTPAAPTDSDQDGMSDAWEIDQFGDLSQPANGDYNSDGYDNIENYFQYLTSGGTTVPVASTVFGAGVTLFGAGSTTFN